MQAERNSFFDNIIPGGRAIGVMLKGAMGIGLAWLMQRYLLRVRPWESVPRAHPARSYEEAVARGEVLQQRDDPAWRVDQSLEPLHDGCGTRLLLHGERTERVVVLLHGYTKCPNQYDALAQLLHQQGYSVIVPRYPFHGYADTMTDALAEMTAERLLETVQEAVDVACGLGEHVTVLGFSLGGLLASWLAQHRADLDYVLIVAAPFTVHTFPAWMNRILANLFIMLPPSFIWWDGKAKADAHRGIFAYPRFPSNSFGHLLRIGLLVQQSARRQRPAARNIVISANPTDESVDNRGAQRLLDRWREHGANVYWHEFDEEWGLAHEIMDPLHKMQQVERVYPLLLELIAGHPEQLTSDAPLAITAG